MTRRYTPEEMREHAMFVEASCMHREDGSRPTCLKEGDSGSLCGYCLCAALLMQAALDAETLQGHREWLKAKSRECDKLAANIRASRTSGGWRGPATFDHAIAAFGAFEKALADLEQRMGEK